MPVSKNFISMELVEGKEFLLDDVACTALPMMTCYNAVAGGEVGEFSFPDILGDITCLFTIVGSFAVSVT